MAALVGTGLSAKRIILAALAATLIAAAVVTIVFVIMSPAHVRFAITDAYTTQMGGGDTDTAGDRTVRLHLTVEANNTSGRAAVMYHSMLVDVSNSTGPHRVNWVRADVATPLPLFQPARNVTAVNASVALVGGAAAEAFAGNVTGDFSVTVSATARFKVGVAWTRLYDIKVTCAPVSFFFSDDDDDDDEDGQSQAAARRRVVDCSAAS
ncbi:hypothetical protein HU200_056440 [Digitaria exilis]|uniref:Late embryogenesis abundant protein LEA-2 subgroup domain-containing protein n=1 Tax=Digitaria exilis TaxID=1010633 RepID=A0A835AFL8_9POAL|nr:hypothetical protein HU200_056440 [Digitaria exilis]CAB3466793.1 unnamed protein product [Digitaria exilis]